MKGEARMALDSKYYCYSDSGGTFTDTFIMTDGELSAGTADAAPGAFFGGLLDFEGKALPERMLK